jgi:hypothetical protein
MRDHLAISWREDMIEEERSGKKIRGRNRE